VAVPVVEMVDKRRQPTPPHVGPAMLPGFQELHFTASLGVALHFQNTIDMALDGLAKEVSKRRIESFLRLSRGLPPTEAPENVVPLMPKGPRNAPCHCGSGIKFKKCCWNKPAPTIPEEE
jgi:hypothetical protein